eukprot:777096-Pleurochrysis_carterae.AAC.1
MWPRACRRRSRQSAPAPKPLSHSHAAGRTLSPMGSVLPQPWYRSTTITSNHRHRVHENRQHGEIRSSSMDCTCSLVRSLRIVKTARLMKIG